MHIGIAGAGLLGRLLALQLSAAGHRVEVFDVARDAGPRETSGTEGAVWTAAGMLSPVAELDRGNEDVFHAGPALVRALPGIVQSLNAGNLPATSMAACWWRTAPTPGPRSAWWACCRPRPDVHHQPSPEPRRSGQPGAQRARAFAGLAAALRRLCDQCTTPCMPCMRKPAARACSGTGVRQWMWWSRRIGAGRYTQSV